MNKTAIALLLLAAFAENVTAASADEPKSARVVSETLFVRRIGPLLREKCAACHGNTPGRIHGFFDVRSLEALLVGGDSGQPGIVPGKADESPLYLAASRSSDDWSAMPPKDAERLTPEQLKWLREWIASGAEWPSAKRIITIERQHAKEWLTEDGVVTETAGGLSSDWTNRKYDPVGLWAYRPVQKPNIENPESKGKSIIDVLIEERMPEGLAVAPRADRRTLIRRATFDLTGLPPAPPEVDAFLNDVNPDHAAFSDVINRLLASPHYGERMAQHWLDVVRYADSSGFSNDYDRGNAWRYRDYVVRSFNEDKPFDQFTREQIAGDEMLESQRVDVRGQNTEYNFAVSPHPSDLIVATGFLRMGPWELTGMEVARIARQRFLDDVTNSVGETFLGHSLQCARCHDHKFDPVPTHDYYSVQAVFATTQLAERHAAFLPQENTSGFDEIVYLQQRKQEYETALGRLDAVLLKNAQAWLADNQVSIEAWDEAVRQAKSGKVGGVFNAARAIMMKRGIPEARVPPKLVGFTPQEFGIERIARKGLERLAWEFDRYQPFALAVYNGHTRSVQAVNAPVRVPANTMDGELEQTCILIGGDPFSSGQSVTPGTLSVISHQVSAVIPELIAGRRLAFSNWIADPMNPLTTRVIVNRIWQWHFGDAIAGNSNNFGSTGRRPTHLRLLDWLAATFVEENWSIKAIHRHVMLSETYCRSTLHPDSGTVRKMDPLGTSYAVFRPRRLNAEELRDAMLMVSGELNPMPGGIPCRPEINQEIALQPRQVMGTFAAAWTPNPKPDQRNRRSIYVLKLRGLMDPMLEVFNSPTPDFSCERRESSIVTPQVFALFNSQNTHARALALANRVLREATDDREALTRCFQLTLSREPAEDELVDFLTHWHQVEQSLPEKASAEPPQPLIVSREAVEENTGEKFSFEEHLYSNNDYVADLQPADVNRHVRALADICLVMLNSNEFVYVY